MDLEIYQLALAASRSAAEIAVAFGRQGSRPPRRRLSKVFDNAVNWEIYAPEIILKNLLPCALGLPRLIAEAHSYRFGAGTDCLVLLEKTMVNCNKMMVYLEQVRDICQTGLEHEFFEELIKKYSYIRRKTLNLQRVWKKYIEHPNAEIVRPLVSGPISPFGTSPSRSTRGQSRQRDDNLK